MRFSDVFTLAHWTTNSPTREAGQWQNYNVPKSNTYVITSPISLIARVMSQVALLSNSRGSSSGDVSDSLLEGNKYLR